MVKVKLFLNSIDYVKEFVNIVSKFAFSVDLGSGRYTIDGKSIMGIFSLDLSRPIMMSVNADESECGELLKQVEKFIVKE